MCSDWVCIDLRELCSFYVAQIEPIATLTGIKLTTRFTEQTAIVRIDTKFFERIFSNIALNALKFTLKEGKVEIRVSGNEETVTLEVEDTGIPRDKLDIIFERFVQVDGSSSRGFGGTGLGLSLVKELCDILGAKISVESAVGCGSTFIIKLPASIENQ